MIKQAAILYNNVIFKGDRHRNIISANKHLTDFRKKGTQGFVTNQGLFVDREQAATIAHQCGQIKEPKKKLISEDLY